MPAYLREFKCIGAACSDNCCIGWDVEFDRKTWRKYQKIGDPEFRKLFEKNVYVNRHSFSPEVDHAKVRLAKDKRCPFLNPDGLCVIQAKFGEEYLSNVCAAYPRYTNEIDGMLEHSANMSCPEAARLALLKPEGIRILEDSAGLDARYIISMSIRTDDRNQGDLARYLHELRDFSIFMIQNRSYMLHDRIMMLGRFFAELQRLEDTRRMSGIPRLIEEHRRKAAEGAKQKPARPAQADPAFSLRLIRELIDKLNVFTEVDSKRYVSLMEEVLKGIQYNRKASPAENAKRYSLSARQYYEPFMEGHGFILENYLVNFMFGNLFPALDVRRSYDAFIMLVLLYALVKFHLTGIAAYHRGLSEMQAVEFIQVFSKTVEHHKTYLETITEYVKKKKIDTPEYMEILISN